MPDLAAPVNHALTKFDGAFPRAALFDPHMKKSTRAPAAGTTRSQHVERLTDAVHRLADEVRVVRDVLSEFQTDFSWLLQNGVPHQPQEFVVVKRMARDPLAADWNERLVVERFPLPQSEAEQRLVYRTGFDLHGVISEVPLQDCPLPVQEFAAQAAESKPESPPKGSPMSSVACESEPPLPSKQLVLF